MRQQVGNLRFDTERELTLLNEIWALEAQYTNYLLAQHKPLEKHRHGAKGTKRYDRAQTPRQRANSHVELADTARTDMDGVFAVPHFAALYDQIQSLAVKLEHVSLAKGLAPIRLVKRAVNRPLHPEVLDEAMIQASRRI